MDDKRHPHLYFEPGDVESLRRKMEDPMFKDDWQAIRKSAESSLEGPPIRKGRQVQALAEAAGAAGRCAFVYRLTGDGRFGKRAREICDAILASDGWTGDFLGMKAGHARFHLETAAICQGLAMAYDMLAPDMTPAERKRFAQTCYDKALKTFLEECHGAMNPYLNGNRAMNWLAVLSGAAGCLFISLDGDGMDFTREIEIARAHVLRFIEWYDDDGSAVEHGGYWVYGMGQALHFLQALNVNGWPEIMHQRSRKLQRVAYPILYGCIGGKNVINFSDDSYGPLSGGRDAALLLAAAFKDRHLQWWAGQLPTGGELGFITGDPNLKAAPPDDLPTCMVFQRTGIGVLRASMTDPDTLFMGIKAGRARGNIYDDPHCQFDLNTIVLDAFGQSLLADPGYGHDWTGDMSVMDPKHPTNSTPPHNTVLVDGKGQDAQFNPLAWLDDLSPSKDIDYVVSRVEQGYGPKVARFDRHVYFVDKRFYVMLDDIELTSPGTVTWSFHGPKEGKLAASQPATITNGQARLRMIPQTTAGIICRKLDDHVLPRLQWDTAGKVDSARVAWLLLPERTGNAAPTPTVELKQDSMIVSDGTKKWTLPIVRRRAPFKSSMTLIRDSGQ
ncbi:MAG: heparinase II/III family protein [Phycisphaerae bacterium]